jgi:predicted transcriptional regulator
MNLNVPADLEARLNRLAAAVGRGAEEGALDLLTRSVEHDEWFRREVDRGRRSAEAVRLLTSDQVTARIHKRFPR